MSVIRFSAAALLALVLAGFSAVAADSAPAPTRPAAAAQLAVATPGDVTWGG